MFSASSALPAGSLFGAFEQRRYALYTLAKRNSSSSIREGIYFSDDGLAHHLFISDEPDLRAGGVRAAGKLLLMVQPQHTHLTFDIPLANLGSTALFTFCFWLRALIRNARASSSDAYQFRSICLFTNDTDEISGDWDGLTGPSDWVISCLVGTFFAPNSIINMSLFPNLSHFTCDAYWSDACGPDLLRIAGDLRISSLTLACSVCSPKLFLDLLRTIVTRIEDHPRSIHDLDLPESSAEDPTDEWLDEVRELLLRLIRFGRIGLIALGWRKGDLWMQEEDWAVVEANKWLTTLRLVTWSEGSPPDWIEAVSEIHDRTEPILSRNRLLEDQTRQTARTLLPAARLILATADCSRRSAAARVPGEIRLLFVEYLADGHLSKRQFRKITDYAADRETLNRAKLGGYKRSFLSKMDFSRWQDDE